MTTPQHCAHIEQIQEVTPSANGCEGSAWPRAIGGFTCASAAPAATWAAATPRKISTPPRTFHATQHPIIQSFQPGEDWMWCYVDQLCTTGGGECGIAEAVERAVV